MVDDLLQQVEELVEQARGFGCLIWLDATGEIVFLDTVDQTAEDRLRAEALVRNLLETEDRRAILHAILAKRRAKALAELETAPPKWDPNKGGNGDAE